MKNCIPQIGISRRKGKFLEKYGLRNLNQIDWIQFKFNVNNEQWNYRYSKKKRKSTSRRKPSKLKKIVPTLLKLFHNVEMERQVSKAFLRGLWFNSSHPHGGSRSFATPVPGDLIPSSGFLRQCPDAVLRCTCSQITHPHKIKKKNLKPKLFY